MAQLGTTLWLIDVDGPLADPTTKRVTQVAVLDVLVDRMLAGECVALNTGRSLPWTVDRVLYPLRHRALLRGCDPDKLLLDHFLIVGEKGGAVAQYVPQTAGNTGAEESHQVALTLSTDPSMRIPPSLQMAVAELVESKYSELMFVDTGKDGMVSVEMRDGLDLERYRQA